MSEIFDSLAYVRLLVKAGFKPEQAEALADAQVSLMNRQLASKQDIKDLEDRMTINSKDLENRMTINSKDLENRLTINSKDLENRLTIRMGAIGAFFTATMIAVIKLI